MASREVTRDGIPEGALQIEQRWLNPALQQTARFLREQHVPEWKAQTVTNMVYVMQAHYIPRLTGEDLPLGIIGVPQDEEFPLLHLYAPEPTPAVENYQRAVLNHWAAEKLQPSVTDLRAVKKELIKDELAECQHRIRSVHPSLFPPHLANDTSSYPVATLDFISEYGASSEGFEEAVMREAEVNGGSYLGLCTFDSEAERQYVLTNFSPQIFVSPPKENTIDYLHPRLGTWTEEMLSRDTILRLKPHTFR